VAHELGHVLGFDHESGATLMQEALAPGARSSVNWNATLDWELGTPSSSVAEFLRVA